MLKCPNCGNEIFVTYKKVPIKIDKLFKEIDSSNEDLSSFNLPKDPWEYSNVEIVCTKCHTLGNFTYFNDVNKNN